MRILLSVLFTLSFFITFAQQRLPAIHPGSLHLRLDNGDSTYLRVMKFGLSYEDPNVVVKFDEEGHTFRYILVPKRRITIMECFISGGIHPALYGTMFCNGFQSRSMSREYLQDEQMEPLPRTRIASEKYSGDHTYYIYQDRKGVLHSWTYTYVRRNNEEIEFLGSLDEDPGFTMIRFSHSYQSFRMERDCSGKVLENEPYTALHGYHRIGNEKVIFDEWAGLYHPGETWENPGTVTVWSAGSLDRHDILKELRRPDSLLPDIILTGEQTENPEALADSIHAVGRKAGISFSPFICEKNSPLVKQHPEWILRDEKGKFLKGGKDDNGWYYVMDIYHEGFRSYLEGKLDTLLRVWQFDLLKADHLSAACTRMRNGKTRGEIMADAMLWLREITKGKLLLAADVPTGSAFRRTDYCQAGNDTGNHWNISKKRSREHPSALASLHSTISRHQLSGRFFINAPGMFTLEKDNKRFSTDQRFTTFLVSRLFGGMWSTSDNTGGYDSVMLELYRQHLEKPAITLKSIVPSADNLAFFIGHTTDTCSMFSFINLSDESRLIDLPLGVNGMIDGFGTNLNTFSDSTYSRDMEMGGIELEKYRSYTALPIFSGQKASSFSLCIPKIFVIPQE